MEQHVFDEFCKIIHRESGIALTSEKVPLLTSRIARRLRALKIEDEKRYLDYMLQDKTGEELINLLDVISTNTTYFWREESHFEWYAEVVNRFRNEGKEELKVWCAASSSGEEPYTLAIILKSMFPNNSKILATDISMTILQRASRGLYPAPSIETLPKNLQKYFKIVDHEGEPWAQIHPSIQQSVLFKRLNLSNFPYPLKGPLDIIFCRNVMIYFQTDLRAKMVQQFERLLVPGGYLVISKTESLIGIQHGLRNLGNSIYQRV
jgi:chemotaxis protein methyltransferase CheR